MLRDRPLRWKDKGLARTRRRGLLLPAAQICVENSQQRRSQKHSPERNDEPQDDGRENGGPHRDAVLTAHQVGLQQKAVKDGDDRIGDQQAHKPLPSGAGNQKSQGGRQQRQHRSEVGDELQQPAQNSPERRQRNMQIPERRQPEQADDDDVVALGNEPALERARGELEVMRRSSRFPASRRLARLTAFRILSQRTKASP